MHLKVWKRIADCARIPSYYDSHLIPIQSRDGAGQRDAMDDSASPVGPDSGGPRITPPAVATGPCALQGEMSIALRTEPLLWQTKQISLRTKPFRPLTEPAMLGEATDTLTGAAASGPQALAPHVFSSRPGTAARFRLTEKVHHGNMSIVWRAFDEVRQTPVAVKFVPRKLAPAFDAQTLERLVRVSQHPGSVTLIEHGWQGEWWYQIAEWVDGKTLSSLCPSYPVSPAHAADLRIWMKQLAGALDAQHRAGFVHGDVKPSNVLVTSGQACLIDLVGLRTGASWTRHGGLTPAFASPEARKGAPADPRDDVYSLAAMICKLLTGEVVTPLPTARGRCPRSSRLRNGRPCAERSTPIGKAVQNPPFN